MNKHRLAIFASGSGTNAENIIRYFADHHAVEIVMVMTNNPMAGVIKRAAALNVPVVTFSRQEFYQSDKISDLLNNNNIDFIILAGFLWLIPDQITSAYKNKIINIHPALLPKYGGKGMYGDRVHAAVKSNMETETGITIHYVNEVYDEGEIIFNAKCAVDPVNESVDDIAEKVHQLEYQYFPQIIEKVLTQINSKT